MTMRMGVNMVSSPIPLEGLPLDQNRAYLAVIALGELVVTISNGSAFTLADGAVWAPQPAPINDISFNGSGILILG